MCGVMSSVTDDTHAVDLLLHLKKHSIRKDIMERLKRRRKKQGREVVLPGMFCGDPDLWLLSLFPLLDVLSLMQLLCTCRAFGHRFVREVQETAARMFMIRTELPYQIQVFEACHRDLNSILHPANIGDWIEATYENDREPYFIEGTEEADGNEEFNGQSAAEALQLQLRAFRGRSSFLQYLSSRRADVELGETTLHVTELDEASNHALDWFIHTVEDVLKDIRMGIQAQNMGEMVVDFYDALEAKRFENLNLPTSGNNFSIFEQLAHAVDQRMVAAKGLLDDLTDLSDALMFHHIVYRIDKGEIHKGACDLIHERVCEVLVCVSVCVRVFVCVWVCVYACMCV